jgi:hypothetical protein
MQEQSNDSFCAWVNGDCENAGWHILCDPVRRPTTSRNPFWFISPPSQIGFFAVD